MSNPPLRRSSRASSVKPEEPKAKATALRTLKRTQSRTLKRTASPEPSEPPKKRARSNKGSADDVDDTKKKTAAKLKAKATVTLSDVDGTKKSSTKSSSTKLKTKSSKSSLSDAEGSKKKAAADKLQSRRGSTSDVESSKKKTTLAKLKAKRGSSTSDLEETKKKSALKAAVAAAVPAKKKVTRQPSTNGIARTHEPIPQLKPYFNPLPTVPDHPRPANQLFAWGAGNFGQFGMGENSLGEFSAPKRNTWIEENIQDNVFGDDSGGLEAIAAGGLHTLFIDEKGTIWSCGVNDDAALGRVTKDVPDPNNPGSFLDVDRLTAVPHPLQSLVDEKFRAVRIAAGDSISAAISSEGELRVWGSFRAAEGSLGFSGETRLEFLPKAILELPHRPGDYERAVQVAAGNNHLLVLTTHGHVYTWGAGEQGQLGRKILDRRKIHGTNPEKTALGVRSNKAVVIGTGNYCSFAVDEDGDVWGWGLNTMGQTGTGISEPKSMSDDIGTPKTIPELSKEALGGDVVVEIAGGEHHTLFLTKQGRVFACGRCDGCQLGLTDDVPTYKERKNPDFFETPTEVKFPTKDDDDQIIHISAGTHNNMAITQGGALFAWGEETQGELGLKDLPEDDKVETPSVIVRREGGSWKAIAVACGGQHTLGMFRKKT